MLFAVAMAVALGAEPRRVSLSEALELARRHPVLETARLRVEAAGGDVSAARAAWLPTAGALGELVVGTANNSTATVFSSPAVDLARIGATKVSASAELSPEASTLVAVGLRQPVWDFGRTAAQIAVAEGALASVQEGARATTLDLSVSVRRAYLQVLLTRAVLEASTEATVRARAHRDFAHAAVSAQLRPPVDLTRAEAALARSEVDEQRAQSDVRLARVRLAAAVGVEAPELDAEPLADPTPAPLPDEATVVAAAEADPVLKAALAAARVRLSQADLAEAQSRPSIALTASVSARNGGAAPSSGTSPYGEGFVPDVPNYAAGVVFSWPFLDLVAANRAGAAATRARLGVPDVAALHLALVSSARAGLERARVTEQALSALARAADAARANAAQADARFTAGLSTITELADAEDLRTSAEIAQAVGRFTALDARAVLDRFLGKE